MADLVSMTITYEEWMELFKPRMDEQNERPIDIDPRVNDGFSPAAFQEAVREHRVWTLVDADGDTEVLQGYHFVNRMEHYYCEVPYDPTHDYTIANE